MLKKLPPSTKPIQTMLDAGMLIDAPAGKFPPIQGIQKDINQHKKDKHDIQQNPLIGVYLTKDGESEIHLPLKDRTNCILLKVEKKRGRKN